MPVAKTPYERNLLDNVRKYGCSVTSVFDPEEKSPSFTYSIGIPKSAGAPEVIIVGLDDKLAHWMVNEYSRRAAAGERFEPGKSYEGFLKGHSIQFGLVTPKHRKAYMRSATWFHGGPEFEAMQLIWPSTSGVWPWAEDASQWLRKNQPLLSEVA